MQHQNTHQSITQPPLPHPILNPHSPLLPAHVCALRHVCAHCFTRLRTVSYVCAVCCVLLAVSSHAELGQRAEGAEAKLREAEGRVADLEARSREEQARVRGVRGGGRG